MAKFIDVSHTIHHGMTTYKGLPAPIISDFLTREESQKHYEPGTAFHIGKIEMVANTGTYLDTPFHRYGEADDLASLRLERIANLEGLVVRTLTTSSPAINPGALEGLEIRDKAVLFNTGWDRNWRTEKYWNGNHPFLTAETADFLVSSGVALVGIDSYNIDSTEDGHRPVHSALLARNIPILEHLCGLFELPDSGFRFFAVPPKVKDFGTFPVRAFAIVEED